MMMMMMTLSRMNFSEYVGHSWLY